MNLDDKIRRLEQDLRDKSAAVERQLRERMAAMQERLRGAQDGAAGPGGGRPALAGRLGTAGPPVQTLRIEMGGDPSLAWLDDVVESDFEVQRYLGGSMALYPTTYCETPREYVEPVIAGIPMTDAQRERLLAEIEEAANHGASIPILASLGVHIPGAGCFINGWGMAAQAGMSPRDLFHSPRGFGRIVTTASHEKWGHGFLSELTALGREKKSVQLGMYQLADQFGLRTVDTPDHARLREQWETLFHASDFVEEGFATWIERYLAERLAEQDERLAGLPETVPYFTARDLVEALRTAPACEAAAAAIAELFSLDTPAVEGVHDRLAAAVEAIEDAGDAFARTAGMPAPYALGCCIADAIAQRHGPKCVPYAAATACNLEYGLKTISNQDLRSFASTRPELNPNTRLAALMYLSAGPRDDVAAFLARVRDELAFTPPGK